MSKIKNYGTSILWTVLAVSLLCNYFLYYKLHEPVIVNINGTYLLGDDAINSTHYVFDDAGNYCSYTQTLGVLSSGKYQELNNNYYFLDADFGEDNFIHLERGGAYMLSGENGDCQYYNKLASYMVFYTIANNNYPDWVIEHKQTESN